MPLVHRAEHVPALFEALTRSDPGRPRLTWYGTEELCPGERVELSARVLGNWVAKTANLLVEEFDVTPDTSVEVDLPPGHWKTYVVLLALASTGAHRVTGADEPADLLVTADAGRAAAAPDVVLVALPALARSWEHPGAQPAPPAAVDFAAVITGYDDVFLPTSPDPDCLGHAAAAGDATWPAQPRFLLTTPPPVAEGSDDHTMFLTLLLGLLLADGSLVVALERTGDERAAIAGQERTSV